jgi:hypothetical protein
MFDLNAKLGREYFFKPTTGNENLHDISNDNGT